MGSVLRDYTRCGLKTAIFFLLLKLERIFSPLLNSLSAFVLKGSVVPNLISGVMGLPTVVSRIQTVLRLMTGLGPCFVCILKKSYSYAQASVI